MNVTNSKRHFAEHISLRRRSVRRNPAIQHYVGHRLCLRSSLQARHTLMLAAPRTGLAVPTGQRRHDVLLEAPSSGLYVVGAALKDECRDGEKKATFDEIAGTSCGKSHASPPTVSDKRGIVSEQHVACQGPRGAPELHGFVGPPCSDAIARRPSRRSRLGQPVHSSLSFSM